MAFALKDAANITVIDRADKKPFMYSDYLNSCSLNISSEAVYARAKGINKISFDGAKEGTFTMETEIFEFKYLALIIGGMVAKEDAEISKRFVGSVNGENKIVLPEKAVEGSISVFRLDKDKKTHIEEVAVELVEENDGKTEITLPAEILATDVVAVYYLLNVPSATKIKVSDKVEGKSFQIDGITSIRNEFGEDELFQIRIFNAKPQTNAELTLSAENVSTFSATFDIMVDENNNMVELTKIEEGMEIPDVISEMEIGKNFVVR